MARKRRFTGFGGTLDDDPDLRAAVGALDFLQRNASKEEDDQPAFGDEDMWKVAEASRRREEARLADERSAERSRALAEKRQRAADEKRDAEQRKVEDQFAKDEAQRAVDQGKEADRVKKEGAAKDKSYFDEQKAREKQGIGPDGEPLEASIPEMAAQSKDRARERAAELALPRHAWLVAYCA